MSEDPTPYTFRTARAPTVTLQFQLTDQQAMALAQFLKRATWHEYRGCAVDEAEAYVMRDSLDLIRDALAMLGYAPR